MKSSIFQNPPKNLIDFCPESLFRLGLLCTQLRRVASRIIKTNHMFLVCKTFQGRNLSKIFGDILEIQWFHKYILTLSDLYNLPWDKIVSFYVTQSQTLAVHIKFWRTLFVYIFRKFLLFYNSSENLKESKQYLLKQDLIKRD